MQNEIPQPGAEPLANIKHEKFAQRYVEGLPAGRAYEAAGYAAKGKSADEAGCRLSKTVKVRDRVRYLQNQAAEAAILTKQEYLLMLTGRAHAELADFYEVAPEGTLQYRLVPDDPDDPDSPLVPLVSKSRAVKKIKARMNYGDPENPQVLYEIELHDGMAAGAEIAKLLGWYPNPKLDMETGSQVFTLQFVEATPEHVAALRADAIDEQ